MPRIRKPGNRIFAVLLDLLCGRQVVDTASGMRVLRRGALGMLDPLPDRLHFTPSMSARALLNGLRVAEVPMHFSPPGPRAGSSRPPGGSEMAGSQADQAEFDRFAASYEEDLNRGLALSGEGKEYFARRRVDWTARRLDRLGIRAQAVLDYGCGTGTAAPLLRDGLGAEQVAGVDVSASSLEVARRDHGADGRIQFALVGDLIPDGSFDLAYSNGVFHHIRPDDRPATVDYVRRSLRPSGLFALWENNPWNPGTRLAMARVPFDRDAIPLPPPEARRLLRSGGFEVVQVDFLFLFPKVLAPLRVVEPMVSGLPLGAQYLVLGRRAD